MEKENGTRDRLINIRVNDTEYEAIFRLAKERGQSVSEMVRIMGSDAEAERTENELLWEKQKRRAMSLLDKGEALVEKNESLVQKAETMLDKVVQEGEAIDQQKEDAFTALNKSMALLAHIETMLGKMPLEKEASNVIADRWQVINEEREKE